MLQREEDQKENIADGSKSKIYEEETFDSISDIAVQVDDEIVEKYSHNIIDKYVSTTVEENELDKLLNSFVGDTENDVILKLDQVSDVYII